jgi:hypothetical protein
LHHKTVRDVAAVQIARARNANQKFTGHPVSMATTLDFDWIGRFVQTPINNSLLRKRLTVIIK